MSDDATPPDSASLDASVRLPADERLVLRWVAAPERATYLAILAVFDEAKARYLRGCHLRSE